MLTIEYCPRKGLTLPDLCIVPYAAGAVKRYLEGEGGHVD